VRGATIEPPGHLRHRIASDSSDETPHLGHGVQSDLGARLRAGDPDALDALMRDLWEPLLRFAIRALHDHDSAQDLVQESFVRLWMVRQRLEAGSVRSYLYRVLRNLIHDEARRRRVRERGALAMANDPERSPTTASPELPRPDPGAAVTRAIADLPARRREAFQLAYLQGLSYREIGEVMGTSPATVKNQVAAALAHLRVSLRPLLSDLSDHAE
jgi:RNA polymerase sigma factor (sigma-70 family)